MDRDAKLYGEAFGEAMDLEQLAREFYEFRGRMVAEQDALNKRLDLMERDTNNIGGALRSGLRNQYVRVVALGGSGAAIVEALLRLLGWHN